MKNTFGSQFTVTLAGESHGEAITVILDGLPAGKKIDEGRIGDALALRRPAGAIATARQEKDEFRILSGVFEGRTCGTPLCILIPNADRRSGDYGDLRYTPRPGHADLAAEAKYGGFQDFRGGGHFSGRITAGLVAAGAIAVGLLAEKGIRIATHVKRCAGIDDRDFTEYPADMELLAGKTFPVLDPDAGRKMEEAILAAKAGGDSVGGILETAVTGYPAGMGEPWFDTAESVLSHILFSVPAVKGVEFGAGFGFADLTGSYANDPILPGDPRPATGTNHNGGINGGITNGMPLLFRCAVKPTPSIGREQMTVDLRTGDAVPITVKGRHDPCIVHRAAHVVNACTAIALYDLLLTGTCRS